MAKPNPLKAIDPEIRQGVQAIANANNTTIISFVAPQGVRTSPVTFTSASIEDSELYPLEEVVKKAAEKNATSCLHFIIHTPGGELYAAYKIATFLRSKFTKICAFVPYEAASGGTVLCCAADELYIGDLGNLTFIDPQIRYKDQRISSYTVVRAVHSLEQQYGEMSPDEIPSPWQQMAEKLDPIIYDEMNTVNFTAMVSASRLLQKSGYTAGEAWEISSSSLARNFYTHEFPLFAKDAEAMGFRVKTDNAIISVYARLVSSRLQEKSPRHAIDFFFPEPETNLEASMRTT